MEHLKLIISSDVDDLLLKKVADRAGSMHAIIGVPVSSLVNAFGLYLNQVSQIVLSLSASLVERSTILQIISLRIQSDLQWQIQQMDAHQSIIDRVEKNLIAICRSQLPWADVIRGILDLFLQIPGISGCGFLRQGSMQNFVAEYISGDFEFLWSAIHHLSPSDQLLLMDRCLIKVVNEQIPLTVPNFSLYDFDSLRVAANQSGVRSAISIPLFEDTGQFFPVLCLISSYPNTFDALSLGRVVTGVLPHLNLAFRRAAELPDFSYGICFSQRRYYRSLLIGGGLMMFYQPIVDLISGAVVKVEALARLKLPNGEILSPVSFLPWFGQSELGELFSRGLFLALNQLNEWDSQGVQLDLNINLPPEILVHPQCLNWISISLKETKISPSRLNLELLESQAPQNQESRDLAIDRLSQMGVNLDMDDLGSGYSSLQRLHLMPFAGIKVDQGIMRGCLEGSSKALGIANSVTTLGRDLDLSVVIEGLENQGLIEVAAILGAHKGQGFGIARPMPECDVLSWVNGWVLNIDPSLPKTALGTWAMFWRWQRFRHFAQSNHSNALTCSIGSFIRVHGLQGGALDDAHQAMHQAISDQDHHATHRHVRRIESYLISLFVDPEFVDNVGDILD